MGREPVDSALPRMDVKRIWNPAVGSFLLSEFQDRSVNNLGRRQISSALQTCKFNETTGVTAEVGSHGSRSGCLWRERTRKQWTASLSETSERASRGSWG